MRHKKKSKRLYGLYERISILQEYAYATQGRTNAKSRTRLDTSIRSICDKHKIPYETLWKWSKRYGDDIKHFDTRHLEAQQRIAYMSEQMKRLRKRNSAMRMMIESSAPEYLQYKKMYLQEREDNTVLRDVVTDMKRKVAGLTQVKEQYRSQARRLKKKLYVYEPDLVDIVERR